MSSAFGQVMIHRNSKLDEAILVSSRGKLFLIPIRFSAFRSPLDGKHDELSELREIFSNIYFPRDLSAPNDLSLSHALGPCGARL
jgi:hypothetical protein